MLHQWHTLYQLDLHFFKKKASFYWLNFDIKQKKIVFMFVLLHEKFLQFDWLREVVFQLNLKYLHVKITKLLRVVV